MKTHHVMPLLTATSLTTHRAIENSNQLNELRGLLSECVQAKVHYYQGQNGSTPELSTDGGTEAAFDSAVIRILDRIEKVVSENWRWEQDPTALQAATKELSVSAERFSEELDLIKHHNRPSVRYNAELVALPNGYAVLFHVPGHPAGGIQGIGETPEKAMDAFDRAFRSAQTRLIARSDAEDSPTDPEPVAPTAEKPPSRSSKTGRGKTKGAK